MGKMSWEEAVLWLQAQPSQQDLVRACYYDDPILAACERFLKSEEWKETSKYLPSQRGSVLDVGAGRGISSYALSRAGWRVTALEPDPSSLVGAGAIRKIVQLTNLPIQVIEEVGEELPFPDQSYELAYGRQVLHHARDLQRFCSEASRILKPGGWFIATREHVISKKEDLPVFLDNHPLHKYYGGENAHLLSEYVQAISSSGLRLKQMLGPFDSVINYYPMSEADWRASCVKRLAGHLGARTARLLTHPRAFYSGVILRRVASRISSLSQSPGRLYSFIAEKPG